MWFNKRVFDWNGSDAKGINIDSDIEDTDSGVEEAILQMDELDLEDDDDNRLEFPPADIDTGGFGPADGQNSEVRYPFRF